MRLFFALLLAGAQQLPAQVPDTVRATVHRLFGTRDFAPERFGPARWIENGAAYTTVERSATGHGMDIVRYATATGARSVYVSAREMTPAADSVPLSFDDYTWSSNRVKLLLFTNTRRVWRQNTRGDYWVLDRATGRLTRLGGDAPPSTLMYAKFSPAADRVAYVRAGDLYVERLADGAITRLTTGASATLVNGMTDWVYEEEFGLRDGFRWSPDGTRIAYWQFDMSGVGTFLLINDTDSLYPFTIPVQYPKVGTANSAVRVGVVSAAGGPTTWIQVPGDLRNTYLPWLEWAGPGELLLQHMNRRQNADDVLLADAATGAVRTVLAERDSAWVDLETDLPWLDGGRRFLWTSERDGWRHVYAVSRDGRDVRLVTPGAYDVVELEAVDSSAGYVYFLASPGDALRRYLYRSRLDGSGAAERVTPTGASGSHAYDISPDARWAIHTASAADAPPTLDLVRLPSHAVARVLVENRKLRAAARPFLTRPTEFFTVTVDSGVALDGFMIRPRDFDSTQDLPGPGVRVRRARRPDGARRLGRVGVALVPRHHGPGLPGGELRQPGHAGAQGPRLAQGRVRADRRAVEPPAGRGDPVPRPLAPLRGLHAGRDLGLERRRLEHAPGDVPLSRRVPGRHGGRVGRRRAALRYDLPGEVHGPPARRFGRLRPRVGHQPGRGAQGPAADRARLGRRQRALSRRRAAGQPVGVARQAVRLHGVSQPLALHLRGRGHDGARLPAADPLPAGAPAGRGALSGRVGGRGRSAARGAERAGLPT